MQLVWYPGAWGRGKDHLHGTHCSRMHLISLANIPQILCMIIFVKSRLHVVPVQACYKPAGQPMYDNVCACTLSSPN